MHRYTVHIFSGLLGGLLYLLPGIAMSSGSYPGRPPQPPTTIDAARYHLGKQIFTGEARLDHRAVADVLQQETRLQELQTLLPKAVQQSVNLPTLADKLSADFLQALEYYLAIRYKIEIKK